MKLFFVLLTVLSMSSCAIAQKNIRTHPPDDLEYTLDPTDPTLQYDPSLEGRKVAVIKIKDGIKDKTADEIDQFFSEIGGAEEIVIELDSPGGHVRAAMRIIEDIKDSRARVTCIVHHLAASAAFMVLQSCPTRLAEPEAVLMLHEAHLPPPKDDKERTLNEKILLDINYVVTLTSCQKLNMSLQDCRATIAGRDWWLFSNEALKLGAITAIVPSTRTVEDNLRYPRG